MQKAAQFQCPAETAAIANMISPATSGFAWLISILPRASGARRRYATPAWRRPTPEKRFVLKSANIPPSNAAALTSRQIMLATGNGRKAKGAKNAATSGLYTKPIHWVYTVSPRSQCDPAKLYVSKDVPLCKRSKGRATRTTKAIVHTIQAAIFQKLLFIEEFVDEG